MVCLNAPYGARCFLTRRTARALDGLRTVRLNAPYGARCFLTTNLRAGIGRIMRLNAPYGARCFLTLAKFDCVLTPDFRS